MYVWDLRNKKSEVIQRAEVDEKSLSALWEAATLHAGTYSIVHIKIEKAGTICIITRRMIS